MPLPDSQLLEAYKATHYHVRALEGTITLKIGEYSAELNSLHKQHAVSSSAFISAHNPYSTLTAAPENDRAHQQLLAHLASNKLLFFEGYGKAPASDWPAEASVLILGVDRSMAKSLGREFRQNAVVFCCKNAIPELLICN